MATEKRSKADIVREYLRKFPDMGPTDMAAKIEGEHPGVKVQSQEVSKLKTRMKAAQGKPAPAAASASKTATSDAVPRRDETVADPHRTTAAGVADRIMELKKAVDAVGGPDQARKLLDILK